jgi:transcription initiation factor TFIIIB Brf1 subunit/transcription initiation factor TFIIB
MSFEEIWAQFDSLKQEQDAEIQLQQSDFFCTCGGLKTFSLELPTCTTCGKQDVSFISDEPEWAGGPDEDGNEDPCRVGMAQNTVLFSEKWGMGTIIKGKNCQKMAKINFHSSMNHRDRALYHAYAEIENICKRNLSLTDNVIEEAKKIYRRFNEDKLTRGAVRTGIKANCVLFACKANNVTRSTEEISQAFGIPVKDLSRTIDMFREVTGEEIKESAGASNILARIFNDVKCIPDLERGRIRMKLITMCKTLENNPNLLGKTPKGIVSAILYTQLINLGYATDRAEISRICGVSVPTLVKIETILKTCVAV